MATTVSLEAAGQELASVIKGWSSGGVEVRDVHYDIAEDRDGIPSINLTVVLADPPAGTDTWPLEEILPLRRVVRSRANEMDLEAPFYLWFLPQTDPPQDDS